MLSRVVAITGGGSGIGRATCERLAAPGTFVAILDSDVRAAEEAAASIVEIHGGEAKGYGLQVEDRDAVFRAFEDIGARFGRVDVCVAAAATAGAIFPFEEVSEADWHRTIDVNLSGLFFTMQAAFAWMRDSGGSIINVASIFGVTATPGAPAYVAAKHAVIGLTKSAALSWGKHDIRVVAVAPTFVRTGMNRTRTDQEWEDLGQLHPLKRLPTSEDVANFIAYLSSPKAAAVSGSVHLIDCGYTAGRSASS